MRPFYRKNPPSAKVLFSKVLDLDDTLDFVISLTLFKTQMIIMMLDFDFMQSAVDMADVDGELNEKDAVEVSFHSCLVLGGCV